MKRYDSEPCTCPPPATHLGEGPDQDCPKHGDRLRSAEPPQVEDMAPGTQAIHDALYALADWGDETQDHYYWGYSGASATIREYADVKYPVAPPADVR